MDFAQDERTRELCARLESFMDSHIYPAEPVYAEQAAKAAEAGDPWRRPPVLAEQGVIQDWIAESRVRIEQARLLVLKTAWLMDTVGNKGAHTEIQAIKVATPAMAEWVIDKAIQAHGAGGVSQDFPLAHMWAAARSLRFADGPDEVHKRSLARRELRRYQAVATSHG